jgi:hypothetical protein
MNHGASDSPLAADRGSAQEKERGWQVITRRDAMFTTLGAVLTVAVIIAGAAVLPLLQTAAKPALPKPDNLYRVRNMGGSFVDEFMFADMLQSLERGQIGVWVSPYGDARWAIRRLPDAHITVDDVVAMVGATPPHLKTAEANNDQSGIHPETAFAARLRKEEDVKRLRVIAKRYPLPEGWPQEAHVWKSMKDRAAGKSYLVPFQLDRPLELNPDGTIAPRRFRPDEVREPMTQIYMDETPNSRNMFQFGQGRGMGDRSTPGPFPPSSRRAEARRKALAEIDAWKDARP